jgi:hypothetical protein
MNEFPAKVIEAFGIQVLKTGGLFASVCFLFSGCSQAPPAAFSPVAGSPVTSSVPTLTSSEVLRRFRERASATEIQQFENLAAARDSDEQDRAMEMMLFKMTGDELFQIGITQNGEAGHYVWSLAVQSNPSAEGSRQFEKTLERIGVKAAGVMALGTVGWYVPRNQFFNAHRAVVAANLPTNEFTIIAPRFKLR